MARTVGRGKVILARLGKVWLRKGQLWNILERRLCHTENRESTFPAGKPHGNKYHMEIQESLMSLEKSSCMRCGRESEHRQVWGAA